MKRFSLLSILIVCLLSACQNREGDDFRDPVDYVNVNMGGIGRLLSPAYPAVRLPNAMMCLTPQREDFSSEQINGFPLFVTSDCKQRVFSISPICQLPDLLPEVVKYSYDNEQVSPYRYTVTLDEAGINADCAPSWQSAVYRFDFQQAGSRCLVLDAANGKLSASGNTISGYQLMEDSTKVYLYLETNIKPVRVGMRDPSGHIYYPESRQPASTLLTIYPQQTKSIVIRYGISLIDTEQAKENLRTQIQIYDVDVVAKAGRNEWNKVLGKIEVRGGTSDDKQVFYTSLYRTYEQMTCISEGGRYYSPFDKQIHNDDGIPFYIGDLAEDTHRAAHPLRILTEPRKERDMVISYLRMAEQSPRGRLPSVTELSGENHSVGEHAVALLADAYAKGLTDFDLNKAFEIARRTIDEKSRIPWTDTQKGSLDRFFDEHGYFPALSPGEQESDPLVTRQGKRRAVSVTLAAAYDYWCLSQLARFAGHSREQQKFLERSYCYRTLFNKSTGFFHPRSAAGKFIEPFDYELPGGQSTCNYYDEANAYIYRWDVRHNPADLIALTGGKENFVHRLDETLNTPLSRPKFVFYRILPKQTGNVGQFSMTCGPAMHIPYLYNYAGKPWKTQKLIRKLLQTWFRKDLSGMPGEEEGGSLSAFVVFSMMGFYPVTPGIPVYNIGSPVFDRITIHLGSGAKFVIDAAGSEKNKYIRAATVNNKILNQPWFSHGDMAMGGVLELKMSAKPNKQWGIDAPPPSADPLPISGK